MSNYQTKNGVLIFTILFAILLLCYSASMYAQQYMYPVAALSDNSIGFIHQSSCEKIELYTWDYLTQTVEPGLPSRFSPAHIALLPENMGFSFIDNGIIRVKFFHKRSPKSFEIAEPIYNINGVFWEKEDNLMFGYFSAQYQDHYALVRIDLDAHITHIIFSKTADFLYPQKVGANIFFIARSIEGSGMRYSLCKLKFDASRESEQEKITYQEYRDEEIKKNIHAEMRGEIGGQQLSDFVLLDFGTQPICFLAVEDPTEYQALTQEIGAQKVVMYVVAYISHTESHATFAYCQIIQEQNNWRKKKLFDFALPTSFLFTQGPNQLYEHIVPLLPKKIGDSIYFSHANPVYSGEKERPADHLEDLAKNNNLIAPESNINIFSYNITTQAIEQVTHACDPGEHYFCPRKHGDDLYYGGTVRAQ